MMKFLGFLYHAKYTIGLRARMCLTWLRSIWVLPLLIGGILFLFPQTAAASTHLYTADSVRTIKSFSTSAHQNLFVPSDMDITQLVITCDESVKATTVGTVTGDKEITGDFTGVTSFQVTTKSGAVIDTRFRRSTLPCVYIDLHGVTLSQVNAGSKDTKYLNNSVFVSDAEHPEYAVSEDRTVEFKGRGNSSWTMAKRSYQIKFAEKTSMLGIKKAKKWTLISNHADASLMRNNLVYRMSADMGMPFTPQSAYIDLWVDSEYIGNFLLCQKLDTNSSSVDLQSEYGVLCELDDLFYNQESHKFRSVKGSYFTLKEYNGDTEAQGVSGFSAFQAKVNAFETELYGSRRWSVLKQYIDEESFVRFFWAEEFSINWDAMYTSNYMYMDGPGDVLHMGPIWDCDLSMGKASGWTAADHMWLTSNRRDCRTTWYTELSKIAEFNALVKQIYQRDVSPAIRQAIKNAQSNYTLLTPSAEMNFIRWKILGQANPLGWATPSRSSYENNVSDLISWMNKRYTYLEGNYGAQAQITFTKEQYLLPRAGLDTATLEYDLMLKGVEIATGDTASRAKVTFTARRIAGFDDENVFKDLTVAQIEAGGYMKAAKSGVIEVTAQVNDVTSTNRAVIIVPGDNNRDGRVSVSDITKMMKLVRGEEAEKGSYDSELCDMNGDGKVSAKDAMLLASMIRKRLTYMN